jgi:hypothetical protein
VEAQALWLAIIIVGYYWVPRPSGLGIVFLQFLFSFLSRFVGLSLLSRALFLSFCERRASSHKDSYTGYC